MEYHERDVRQHRDGAGSCLVERMRREVDHTGDRIVLSSRVKFNRNFVSCTTRTHLEISPACVDYDEILPRLFRLDEVCHDFV